MKILLCLFALTVSLANAQTQGTQAAADTAWQQCKRDQQSCETQFNLTWLHSSIFNSSLHDANERWVGWASEGFVLPMFYWEQLDNSLIGTAGHSRVKMMQDIIDTSDTWDAADELYTDAEQSYWDQWGLSENITNWLPCTSLWTLASVKYGEAESSYDTAHANGATAYESWQLFELMAEYEYQQWAYGF